MEIIRYMQKYSAANALSCDIFYIFAVLNN